MKNYIKKIISLQITTSLFLQQTLIANNLAVDTTAPKNNQANIEKARNGVPVVNIVAPNQSGLSHNKFSDYNVNKDGLILNNSNKQEVNTQLAGYIYGNRNLRNGTAKTILNEVTSKNRTYLKGFTEVAGDRASVVVANPNGIYINGAGFINTYKATITTGNPNIINHELRGFDVKTGQIDIDGSGLNVSNVNKAELYAKTVSLNAKIYAQNLDVVTGENKILQDGTIKNIEDVVKEKPLLSLDSSSLGGIYANKISLIGTQKGVGVNLPIEIITQDSLVLSADGKIFLDKVSSEKDVDIVSKNDSINTNIVYANSINMEAKNDITNEELIIAQNSISLKANDIVNKNAIATLNKDIDITAKNLTNYNTIYSNDSVNLYVEDTLLNSTNSSVVDLGDNKATIYAVNNINIQGNENKTLRTEEIINDKSVIQTQNGDINVFAKRLDNFNDEVVIEVKNSVSGILFFGVTNSFQDLYVQTSFYNLGENAIINNLRAENIEVTTEKVLEKLRDKYSYLSDIMTPVYSPGSGFFDYYLRIINPNYIFPFSKNYLINYSSKEDYFVLKPLLKAGGEIVSNNNINFDVLNLENKISTISAKNNILFTNTTLNNISNSIYRYSNISGGSDICLDKCINFFITPSTSQTKLDSLDSIIEAGNSISGTLTQLNNENQARVSNVEFTTYNPSNYLVSTIVKDKTLNEKYEYVLPTNKYGMFVSVDSNKDLDYLVESNPLYTNYSNFIGSSYLLEKINYRGDRKIKRLGDAAYETKLVSDAIFRLTGQRVLNPDFQNENEQFISLMENAVNLNVSIGFELGKPLSQEQIASLTEDIVWMEEQIVDGKLVLVPVVYLAQDYEYLKGASIVAKNIDLDIKDNLNNSGTVKTNENMNISANSITNNAGVLLSKGKATLISNDDFVNKNGGSIKGSDVQIASINGSVINETYSKQNYVEFGINNFTYTNIGKTSSIEATNGNLVIQANKDITNIGANLKAKDNILLQTKTGDINLNAIKLEQGHNVYFKGGFNKAKDVNYQVSNIQANNILMQSGNNINLEASKLNANNQINLNAQNDVNILALNSEYYRDTQTTTKGTFSKKTTRDMEYKESVNSSEFDANNIYISSGNDVNLQATKLKAKENIVVDADNSINILAKEYKEGSLHQTSKSSFGGLKKSLDISSTDALKLNSALLETQALNIVLNSGKDINILASEINSAGDIQLKALEDILIASQSEYLAKKEVHEKSSFNLAGLVSLIVPVETTLYSQKISKNDKVNSTNVSSSLNAKNDIKIDSGSTTIVGSNLEANNIDIKADTGEINIVSSQDLENMSSFERKIEVGLSDITSVIKDQYKDLMKGNTKLKFELGSAQFDEVDQSSQRVTNNASSLKARESIVLDSLSDINIVGSNLQSEDNITLSSTVGDVNILNTIDSYSENIDEKHGSAKISLTLQNEYVEIAQAVDSAVKSAEQLKQTKEDYSNYKSEVKKLENNLSKLKQSYKNKEVGVDYSDIEDLSDFIDNLKSQEKYYVAAIASATADLASKTAAIATQAAAAYASSGTLGFSVGVSLDVDGSKTTTQNKTTTSNASNLVSNNITINTKEDTNITGSNIVANDSLNINTKNLNVKASQDTNQISQDKKSINGSVNLTMYGGGGGTASLGGGKQSFQSSSVTNNNSQLLANNVNIDVKNDAVFQGANLRAEDTLNLNVGNNLIVESLRDEYSSNQSGFNVNAGMGANTTNAGLSMNNGVSQSKQTVLSSITGNEVNINVDGNTHLKGSLISSDEDNLNFTTNTLTFANSSNSSYSSSKTIGGSISSNVKGDVSNLGYNSSNSLEADASKTLATLGTGNIIIKDKDNSDDITKLNQDVNAINKDLYSSQTGTKVDATLDTRLLTEEGREQIKKDFEELADNVDSLNRYLKDKFGENKLTEDKKTSIQNDIKDLGKEETLAKSLRENGVSEEEIKRVLENETVQKLLENEIVNNTSTLDEIVVTPTKDLQDYLLNTAQGINELVNIVGEDKVAGAIFVTQVLLQGTLATAKGLVSDEVNSYLTSGVKNSLSEYIADKYFGINEEDWNINQQNAIKNISDLSSEFAIDTLISGGAFGIIKGASKLGKANDGLVNSSTVDSPVFNNTKDTNGNIFTQKTEYQAPQNGTGNNYTVYQRSDIDLDTKFLTKEGKKTTNREIMEKGGTPYVKDSNGNMVQLNLHHSQQQGRGPLFEITSTTHQNSTNKQALHPYGQNKNPNDPVDRTSFDKDRNQYWKDRLNEMEKEK